MNNILIVGAGLSGSVLAERIASQAQKNVLVIDRRNHFGGNCWSEVDQQTNVEYHKYGSHIFHTSYEDVWSYITQFTQFNAYRHTVWTTYKGQVYPMPINLGTINSYYKKDFSPEQAKAFIQSESEKEKIDNPTSLEEKAIQFIGRPLYEAFIQGYTAKQWEKDPKELSADIITRLPVRYNYNNRYFSDAHEGIPLNGYARMFETLLNHPNIQVQLQTDYRDIAPQLSKNSLIIWTGPIDAFFQHKLGHLEWRTVDFEVERFDFADYLGTTVMNYADVEVPFTRIHEFKHYHPEREDSGKTLIYREYARAAHKNDEPYYPVSTQQNRDLYAQYKELARTEAPNVIFAGRLGSYRYYDMDDAIKAALDCFQNDVLPRVS